MTRPTARTPKREREEINGPSLTTGDTQITEYAWDHRNRLVSVTDYDDYADYTGEDPSQAVEYTYDVVDQRVFTTGAKESRTPRNNDTSTVISTSTRRIA